MHDFQVTIRRVSNGWTVTVEAEMAEATCLSVHQDPSTVAHAGQFNEEAESLRDALLHAFEGWTHTKHRAGLAITTQPGRAHIIDDDDSE